MTDNFKISLFKQGKEDGSAELLGASYLALKMPQKQKIEDKSFMSEYSGNEIMEDLDEVYNCKTKLDINMLISILTSYDMNLEIEIAIPTSKDKSHFKFYKPCKFGINYSSDGFFDKDFLIIECKEQ